MELTCRVCGYEANQDVDLKKHTVEKHDSMQSNSIACTLCDYKAEQESHLKKHIENHHLTPVNVQLHQNEGHVVAISCDKCEYTCKLNIQLRRHKKMKHEPENVTEYCCVCCEFKSFYLTDLWTHKLTYHAPEDLQYNPVKKSPTDLILNILAEQNADIMEELSKLKTSLNGAFNHLGNGIQENFDKLADDNKNESGTIKAALASIHNKVIRMENVQTVRSETLPSGPSVPQPSAPPPTTGPLPSTSAPSSAPVRPSAPRRKPKTVYISKPRVLYVGDSIAHNVEIKHIENRTGSRITSKKAYSSIHCKKARWPNANVKDITEKALSEAHKDDKYEHVVLSAPTVDVTNLDTSKIQPSDNVEVFKQEVFISCKNMMTVAQNALVTHPNIKNVVILEHPPRFDTEDKDPLSIKPELAKYANSVYRQLWFESNLKHKIVVGQHKLECSEKTRFDRFTNRMNGRYDGVHMYGAAGRKAYTDSVLSIFSSNIAAPRLRPSPADDHSNCPQAKYMNAQKSQSERRYSVPVQNRFNVLGN